MTKKEKMIASAYTGVQFVNNRKDLQEYFNKLLKRNIDLWHISPEIQEELRKASTADFLDMVGANKLAYYALGVKGEWIDDKGHSAMITAEVKLKILKNMIKRYRKQGGMSNPPKKQMDFFDKLMEIIEMEGE